MSDSQTAKIYFAIYYWFAKADYKIINYSKLNHNSRFKTIVSQLANQPVDQNIISNHISEELINSFIENNIIKKQYSRAEFT